MTANPSTAAGRTHTVINIFINDEHFKVTQEVMTGAQLRALASIADGNQLFQEVPGPGDDLPVAADSTVHLKSGMRFYDVPVGNLG
jgi:hypothetical protein